MNYISLGNHCVVADFLSKNGLRKCSYPFDWLEINLDGIFRYLTMLLIDKLPVELIVNDFLKHTNNFHNVTQEQLIRRFNKLYNIIYSKEKIIFIHISRFICDATYYINKIIDMLYTINNNSTFILINSVPIPSFIDDKFKNIVFLEYVDYPKEQCWVYDYTFFRSKCSSIILNNLVS